ncbi:MAG: hypothetical protein ACRCSC_01855 [Lactococcus garvieae]
MEKEFIKVVSDESQEAIITVSKNKVAFALIVIALFIGFIIYKVDWNTLILSRVRDEVKTAPLSTKEKDKAIESVDKLIEITAQ